MLRALPHCKRAEQNAGQNSTEQDDFEGSHRFGSTSARSRPVIVSHLIALTREDREEAQPGGLGYGRRWYS
jgi:hypothetical protein